MPLTKYREKRNFEISAQPFGNSQNTTGEQQPRLYVIQEHRTTQLHFDFCLESNGVLLSWAVPKRPSLDPSAKRLAMQVKNHPREYASCEAVILKGEYCGGTVMVWDTGQWSPESKDVAAALRTRGYRSEADKSWLLIKHRDQYASTTDISKEEPRSALDIARESGADVEKAATGDPGNKSKANARAIKPRSRKQKRGTR
jgi:bifunctional non-homologous end joining protein LigD